MKQYVYLFNFLLNILSHYSEVTNFYQWMKAKQQPYCEGMISAAVCVRNLGVCYDMSFLE
jgi:hypothetical protein